ncbi:MAG: integral rane protein [Ignavibacteria bacterium]|nr:integral rane protein [Ignavibacteria bacterium]
MQIVKEENSNNIRKLLKGTKLKTFFKFAISIILILVSGYYSIKGIPLSDIQNTIIQSNYLWVILSIPFILLAHFLRGMRWKTMLEPIGEVKSYLNLFKAVMIGYFANSVTPRGGELLRPYVYARSEGFSFSSTFATIIVERVIDLLTLLTLFGLSLLLFSEKIIFALEATFTRLNVNISPANFLSLIVIIVFVLIISFYPPFIRFFLKILIRPFSHKIYERLISLFDKFQKGFAIIKKPSRYFRMAMESVAIWICYGAPMFLMFYSFGFQARLNLTPGDAFLLLIVVGVAVTIAPTPGAIGVHHVAVRWAMMALYATSGLTEREAVGYAILTHGTNFIVNTLVGAYFYLREKKIIPETEKISEELEESSG